MLGPKLLSLHNVQYYAKLMKDIQRAIREDVDVSDHGAWDTWLGNAAVSCATRMERRKTL